MKARRLQRDELGTPAATPAALRGLVLCHDVRAADGARGLAKGRVLDDADVRALASLEWGELHLVEMAADEVHEDEAGARLARAVAGAGVEPGAPSGGHWPLVSRTRGLLDLSPERLEGVNAIDGICVYTLYGGQVVDVGEVVARAKVTPFAIPEARLAEAEGRARAAGGLVRVRPFRPARVGAVVQETLGDRGMGRFRDALGEKLAWLGSTLEGPAFVPPNEVAVADAIRALVDGGADVVTLAGTKAMDPLDPAFLALERLGVALERHGVPAHPGSLFWMAHYRGVPLLGMPTCGLFSQASVFDLVLPRVLAGEPFGRAEMAALGHGGLLTREMAFRFPPYRARAARGAVDDAVA